MRIIFHIPIHIDRADPSASQIRPQKLMAAFAELGYEVDVVEGYGAERRRRIADIKRRIRQGVRYDFLYSESSTMPTLLTERHHLPTYPFLDFGFFRFCKRHSIPIGLFYRDIYWRFINKGAGFRQRVASLFYRYDLFRYRHLLSALYLPTLRMRQYVPGRFDCTVMELPSGCPYQPLQRGPQHDNIELFYVGGMGGDYDLRSLVRAVAATKGVHLTLCCRTYDWDLVKEDYLPLLNDHIAVVHESGAALLPRFVQADLFAMMFTPSEYRSFAAPYKLFEALGYGLPIMATEDTWAGDYVRREGIGTVCRNEEADISEKLTYLLQHREALEQWRKSIPRVAQNNTWQARCQQIANSLTAS